ncbi:MAG: tetratricopeptide repeat protein [Bacteroidota bacterium]
MTTSLFAQKPELAYSYFRNGEYEKAIMLYKPLHEKNKVRRDYFKNLLTCYQQLEYFDLSEELIRQQINDFPNQKYQKIELGYNYQLQNKIIKANEYYEEALDVVRKNPNFVYAIGQAFRQNHLLDYALKSYEMAKALNPKLVTDIQVAQIYGEKGELEKMFNSYLNLIEINEKYQPTIQRYIGQFISNDPQNDSNKLLKKLLLIRSQNNPKDAYNILLSWLYVQQKEYDKALIQEKSLFARNQLNTLKIVEIGKISFESQDYKTAKQAFQFLLENTADNSIGLSAENYLMQIAIFDPGNKNQEIDQQFQELFRKYGENNTTIGLQLTYADFIAFQMDEPQRAIELLTKTQNFATSALQNGEIKIKQADILVYTGMFNRALILYSQVQTNLKNSPIAQKARFKVAQTSYFKGDFKWAQAQLKVLKSSTSQLIANDALELNLLISNNIDKDSVQKPLRLYAQVDLLSYQNKKQRAIDSLDVILTKFKGHPIEDDALFKQAELFKKEKNYQAAEQNYLRIVSLYKESVLADDACFHLAKLYQNEFQDILKAKEMYEKIIFNYPSSIYLVDARREYRKLRGDDL